MADNLIAPKSQGEGVPEFPGNVRLMAEPLSVVKADIEVEEGTLALIVSDYEVGEWPLEDVEIDLTFDGFHMSVEGEEFVFITPQTAAFARAVGVDPDSSKPQKKSRGKKAVKPEKAPKPAKAPKAKSRKESKREREPRYQDEPRAAIYHARPVYKDRGGFESRPDPEPVKPTRPERVRTEIDPDSPQAKVKEFFGDIDYSASATRITGAVLGIALLLLVFARGVLATVLLTLGMISLVVAGAAVIDPIVAARLPDGWPPMRLIRTSAIAVVVGMILLAF
jgi:hypothetical protein